MTRGLYETVAAATRGRRDTVRIMRMLAVLLLAFTLRADTLLVANRGGSTVTLIDPQTMTLLGTVTVGNDPHEIAVSADGRRAYVSNYGNSFGSTISIVDIDARAKIKDVSIAPLVGPHGIVERNGKIWFTAERSGAVGRYDPAADRVDWVGNTTQNGGHMLAVNFYGTTVYTANISSGSASIIDVGTGASSTARKVIPTVAAAEGIALSPDQNELWIGSVNFAGISIISLQSESVVQTIPGVFAYRLVFTTDGRSVLVPRAGQIAVYDVPTRTQVRSIPLSGQPLSVLPAENNRIAYVGLNNPSRVIKLDLRTNEILGTVPLPPNPDGLALARVPGPYPKRRAARS